MEYALVLLIAYTAYRSGLRQIQGCTSRSYLSGHHSLAIRTTGREESPV